MQKFEYMSLGDQLEDKVLNDLGQKGWELIAVDNYIFSDRDGDVTTNSRYIFKKLIK